MPSLVQRAINKARRIAIRKSSAFRSPLNVALIGYGGIGPDHLDSYEMTGIARVVAISDMSPGALAGALRRRPYARAYRDYRHMLQEVRPDVVSICTWPQSHAQIAKEAAAAGVKGILCEKPMALQLGEIEDMMRECEQRGVKLAVGHQFRFNPWFIRARELVKSGALGALTAVRGHNVGVLADTGPHLIDSVRFILGDRPALRARCVCVREKGVVRQGIPAEDSTSGEIEFEGGVTFSFVNGETAPTYFGVTIEGTTGTLELTYDSLKGTGSVQSVYVVGRTDYNLQQFGQFIRWVKGQSTSYIADASQGARSGELILALYESARTGGTVELPLTNKGSVIEQLYPDAPPAPLLLSTAPTAAVAALPADQRLAMHGGSRACPSWYDGSPTVGKPELINLTKVILSRKMNCTEGTMVTRTQDAFAKLYGAKHAVASTSGTAAIHVAMGALMLNPGDEVITTPMSDMGTVIPILACNCLPVFADIDPRTGMLTAESIAKKITPRTKAVILVHLFGRPADLDPICELLRAKGIALIEDCAQAHYAQYKGRCVGTFGAFGCFSLQQSKQITCGDGGITICNDDELAERAALFSDKGWMRSRAGRAGRNHFFLGMNYRMTELQGAVALAQAQRLPGFIATRRARADELTRQLEKVPGVIPPADPSGVVPSWWIYSFTIDEARLGVSVDEFNDALTVEGLNVGAHYLPKPLFEYDVLKVPRTYGTSGYPFSAYPHETWRIEDFPGFTEFNRRMMLLFWSHNVTSQHVDGIARAVEKVAAQLK